MALSKEEKQRKKTYVKAKKKAVRPWSILTGISATLMVILIIAAVVVAAALVVVMIMKKKQ